MGFLDDIFDDLAGSADRQFKTGDWVRIGACHIGGQELIGEVVGLCFEGDYDYCTVQPRYNVDMLGSKTQDLGNRIVVLRWQCEKIDRPS